MRSHDKQVPAGVKGGGGVGELLEMVNFTLRHFN